MIQSTQNRACLFLVDLAGLIPVLPSTYGISQVFGYPLEPSATERPGNSLSSSHTSVENMLELLE